MSILNYLPKFKVVEVNRLTGLIAGHMLSQFKGDADLTVKKVGDAKFLENGLIVGLNDDLTVGNYDAAEHAQPFLVFNEELNTFMNGLKYYAEPVVDGEVYPRSIGLFVGDAFTTNNYAGEEGDFAAVVKGVLTLGADGIFGAEESTLPTGEKAYKFTYIGEVKE